MASGANVLVTGGVTMRQVVAGTDIVDSVDFNNARTNVDRLLGTAQDVTLGTYTESSTWGYSQGGAGVSAASTGGIVYADNATGGFKRLQDDVQSLCAFLGQSLRPGVGTDVTSSNSITATTWNNLMLNIKDCWDNRFSPASLTSAQVGTISSGAIAWQNTYTQVSTWTFASESACRAFFNGGGAIGFNTSFQAAGSDAISVAWTNRLNNVGTVYLYHNTTTANVATTGLGFYNLTTTNQLLVNYYGAAAPYSNDNFRTSARVNSTTNPTQVIITLSYIDGLDGGIDHNPYGTLTVNNRKRQPDASGSGFSFDVPTVSAGAFSGS